MNRSLIRGALCGVLFGCTSVSPGSDATEIPDRRGSSGDSREAPRNGARASGAELRNAPVNGVPLLSPYPPGRWRQAGSVLSRVVIWPSHILIGYAGARNTTDVSFSMADFHSVPRAPTRSRDEALALSRSLLVELRAAPQRFAELARQRSEDLVRGEHGGTLGGLPAAQLDAWPQVLDALFAIAPGEISDVVETPYGFHIFTRRAPPPEQTVTGRRIVIGHADARWLGALEAGPPPTRAREEALQLAELIYEKAAARPDGFQALVAEYSELRDRVLGGDFGTWTNRELAAFPREIEVLSGLEVGAVSRPFDSVFGVQIVQRVANPERGELAMEGVRLSFDPDMPEAAPSSRASVLARARVLSARLRETPTLLRELQGEPGVQPFAGQWTEGRGSPELMAALAGAQLDHVLPEPVRSARQYFVGRRVAPGAPRFEAPLFELPVSGPDG